MALERPIEPPEAPVLASRDPEVSPSAIAEGRIEKERTGLLILRAWLEDASGSPLRARVRFTTDVSEGYQRTLNLADIEAVCSAVDGWLRDLMSDSEAAESRGVELGQGDRRLSS